MSLNPRSVRNLRLQINVVHLLPITDIIVMFETDSIGQTPSSLERCLVIQYSILLVLLNSGELPTASRKQAANASISFKEGLRGSEDC